METVKVIFAHCSNCYLGAVLYRSKQLSMEWPLANGRYAATISTGIEYSGTSPSRALAR